ncbi:MAG: CDP-diacylglycerol--serine O-phosphatidyltransferase [Candidatus Riflebacteria bacterium]|nr:CDP-diacylglycerol--serine O-phosphatidyltransferase [Candidatus Riflebacteria bacterium]
METNNNNNYFDNDEIINEGTQANPDSTENFIKKTNVSESETKTDASLNPKERRKKALRKHLSIIPNSCTSMNLVCGFMSILMASHGEFLAASWLILIANIFDILDGRLARLTSVESQFGGELDSLCDLVSFGVAPAFLVYTLHFKDEASILGMFVSVIFVLCGAIRLARFNVTPHSHKDVFEGMPIPGGAGILVTMVIFEMLYFSYMHIPSFVVAIIMVVTAFLMVSKIEYPAMKKTPKTSKKRIFGVLFVIIAFVINPPITLFFATWGFAFYGLFMATFRVLLGFGRRVKNRKKSIATATVGNDE